MGPREEGIRRQSSSGVVILKTGTRRAFHRRDAEQNELFLRVSALEMSRVMRVAVLEGLVALGDGVRQRGGVLPLQGCGLYLVAVAQQRAVISLQLIGELARRYALREATQDQHYFGVGLL